MSCEFTKVIFCSKNIGLKCRIIKAFWYTKNIWIYFFTSEKLQEESKGKISEITDKIGTLSEKLERYFNLLLWMFIKQITFVHIEFNKLHHICHEVWWNRGSYM